MGAALSTVLARLLACGGGGRLWLQHVPRTATQAELAEHMGHAGQVVRLKILKIISSAVCEYESVEEAQRAVRELNNQVFKGNKLYIRALPAGRQADTTTAPSEVRAATGACIPFRLVPSSRHRDGRSNARRTGRGTHTDRVQPKRTVV